ncbi:conserved hypothetical protein [Flavobacterium sp. 9AF]|uniref:hypothetical protein n=1 Tax=Flavobacterium sp. 9AF TaxID=2653142 RepID=UPI0012F359E1|nr:hypothetical protein [Flavobacterium sp. 9AF]VXC33739.1 conserved hypothetical protein [Flavobacterium sp. 9AF]
MKATTANMENTKPTKKGNVPNADLNFGNVVTTVSAKWLTNNWLTLHWLTATQFQTDAINYNATLEARLQTGATRPQLTQSLKALDKTIDNALSYVKGYIIDKYKKENATSYYAAFGIEYKGKKYVFPSDQNKRIAALKLMIDSLAIHGFENKEYGVAFWTPLLEQYSLFVKEATKTDGQVAIKVGDKNALKENLKKGLNAIVYTLKANYPDSYKQELRDWGFQKEKY